MAKRKKTRKDKQKMSDSGRVKFEHRQSKYAQKLARRRRDSFRLTGRFDMPYPVLWADQDEEENTDEPSS